MSHSVRQLVTIRDFATTSMGGQYVLHSGPFGCGKTYSLVEAFGLYCYRLKALGFTGLQFVLLGKTQQSVKRNMCNVLSKLYGADFHYDGSRADGKIKDAVLFGQYICIIGLNDSSAESKFRGLSDVMGILHDEAVLCTREQFDLVMSRLRGSLLEGFPNNYIQHWYVGSTNPDTPNHFLLEYVESGLIHMVKWTTDDAKWEGAVEYYERLRKLYKNNMAFYNRYLKGEWTSADRMVYYMFNSKVHVLDGEVDYKQMRRNFIGVDYGGDHPTGITLSSINYQGIYITSKSMKLRNTAPSSICTEVGKWVQFLIDEGSYCDNVYVDPSAKALKDEMTKAGIKFSNALNSHNDGIGFIQTQLATNRAFIMSSCEDLISEIYSYRYKDNNSGKDEVVKIGDDLVDSWRYGVYSDSVVRR